MEGEEGTMFPIMSLPEEIRGKVYNFLEQKQAMGLRLVCRQWQDEIYSFYNYHLKLDERNPHLQDILDRSRITDCTTGQFLLTPPNRTRIFKNANLIQYLNIRKASISPENLHALLTECSKSLKRLEIRLNRPLLRYDYPQTHFHFPNLRYLVVFVCTPHPYEEVLSPVQQAHIDQEVLMINQLLRDSNKPKLAKISIKLIYQTSLQADWYTSTILSTIANHPKTLSRISLSFEYAWIGMDYRRVVDAVPPYPLRQKESAQVREVDNLHDLSIRNHRDEGAGAIDLMLMVELTMNQKKLERLRINVVKFELMFLQEICWKCFESLVSIDVRFSHCTFKTFDASCLKDCKNLKDLFMENLLSRTGNDESYSIRNFHLLPESIEKLVIWKMLILTNQLEGISTSGFKKLRNLWLVNSGDSGLYGIDGKVFQKVVQLPELCFAFLRDLRFSDSEEEANFIRFRDSLIPTLYTSSGMSAIAITRDIPSKPFSQC